MDVRMTTAPSLVLACVFYANDTSVGIVSACLHPGFVRTSSVIGERSSTLSFIIPRFRSFARQNLQQCKAYLQEWRWCHTVRYFLIFNIQPTLPNLKPTGLMWQQGIWFIMRQLLTTIIISLSLAITGIAAYAANTSSASHSQGLISTLDTQYLGMINLCDSNGITCYTWHAYKNSAGRIYVSKHKTNSPIYFAQKSNDSRWEYMIRYQNDWYYFSF